LVVIAMSNKQASKQAKVGNEASADALAAERQRLAELQERRAKLERRPEEITRRAPAAGASY
jgi:hypothetical protein